ncbi:MAG: hypothetical protein IKQ46_06865 [Bacteroidales bacterium]|nr:hypothetical protein [Bacteroidales bacterium]
MDIQSIIKQLLSLAETVIKNPSTSISNSGLDLSSLTKMAGGLWGGASSDKSSESGLGSLIGSAISSGALGSLGNLFGASSEKASENSDLLNQIISKAGIIKNMLSGDSSSNLNSEQKTNLSDVLNLLNVAKGFLGGK